MKIDREYPREARLGSSAIRLRLLTPADRELVWALTRTLPEHDLLFLHRDLSRREGVDAWLADLAEGRLATVVAEEHGVLPGFATIQPESDAFSRHVAELCVVVAPSQRGRGLGQILTQEAFAIALSAGIEKITGRMTPDQGAAIRTFEGLGFRPEALLQGHVKDAAGQKHDLLILAHDVAAFHAALEAYGVTEAFES